MHTLRPAAERGHALFDWLDSHHSFSFGHYYDPRHMGVSILRVINEDQVVPGGGFETHSHNNMEIISYVLSGVLEHRDSMGNHSRIRPGEVQLMSAGRGVTHSEFNPDGSEPVHFLQIWIRPDVRDTEPGYQQALIPEQGAVRLLVSPDGAEESLRVRQDARLYRIRLAPGQNLEQELSPRRTYYLQLARGDAMLNDLVLAAGDGVTIAAETVLKLQTRQGLEALLFDLP